MIGRSYMLILWAFFRWISYISATHELRAYCVTCSFYRCQFDPDSGGEMKQLEFRNVLKLQEEEEEESVWLLGEEKYTFHELVVKNRVYMIIGLLVHGQCLLFVHIKSSKQYWFFVVWLYLMSCSFYKFWKQNAINATIFFSFLINLSIVLLYILL